MFGMEMSLQGGGDGLCTCRSGQRLNDQQSSYNEGSKCLQIAYVTQLQSDLFLWQ